MTVGQRLAALGALAFLALLRQTLLTVGTAGMSEVLSQPWCLVTLADFYLGVLVFSLVIFYFERVTVQPRSGPWALALWGNPWAVLWLLFRGRRLFPPKSGT
jgi:Protein of unknown function (DUF1475).